MIRKALPSIKMEVIEDLGILLQWFVLRFCESNISCLLKSSNASFVRRSVVSMLSGKLINAVLGSLLVLICLLCAVPGWNVKHVQVLIFYMCNCFSLLLSWIVEPILCKMLMSRTSNRLLILLPTLLQLQQSFQKMCSLPFRYLPNVLLSVPW